MSRTDELAAVIALAMLTEDRAPEEQRALLATALRVDKERGAFTTMNKRPVEPWLTTAVEQTYAPDGGRRATLTAAQRAQLGKLTEKWKPCADCGHPVGAHTAEGCPRMG